LTVGDPAARSCSPAA